jgi:hypothetical protein
MTLHTSTFPLAAAPVDEVWVICRDFEDDAKVSIKSLTSSATCTLTSGAAFDLNNMGSPVNVSFSQEGIIDLQNIPTSGVRTDRATRILVTSGKVSITITSPTPFTSFMRAPTASNFSL